MGGNSALAEGCVCTEAFPAFSSQAMHGRVSELVRVTRSRNLQTLAMAVVMQQNLDSVVVANRPTAVQMHRFSEGKQSQQ